MIGLIGGTSWHATVEYYKYINRKVEEVKGENPPLLLHSINMSVMRTQNKKKISEKFLEVSLQLENSGAQAILFCANTPHIAYDFVQPQISIPILHIAVATGKEAERLGLQNLGLLGTHQTMTEGFIPKILKEKFSIETIIPEGQNKDRCHDFIAKELTQGKFTNRARQFFEDEIERFKNRGADGVILGCTELPILLKDMETALPALPTTSLHAQMAVDFILSSEVRN